MGAAGGVLGSTYRCSICATRSDTSGTSFRSPFSAAFIAIPAAQRKRQRLLGAVEVFDIVRQVIGFEEDTIVFYYGDNGGVLARSKRFCFESGLHVPLIVQFAKKWQHLAPAAPGSRLDAPVSFVDFAPSVLSLAGIEAPKYMEGRAFPGKQNAGPQEYAFCFRNRMDERYDFVRSVRDKRYHYLHNYMPHVPHGQHVQYMFNQKSVQEWWTMYQTDKNNHVQRAAQYTATVLKGETPE
ncbi:MAG: sulfatase-like hydrolase/transferase [Tepidisphaeraceae bacterium]